MTSLIGWASSALLLATLSYQIYQQWQSGQAQGISLALFGGEVAASIGFTLYSVLQRDWVFVVTNSLLVVNAVVGLWVTIVLKHRTTQSRA